jgi:Domain of unknown function (DUF4258)
MPIGHTAENVEHQRNDTQSGSSHIEPRFRERILPIRPVIRILVAALVIALPLLAPHNSTLHGAREARLVAWSTAPAQVPSRPRHVAGYSTHAKQRMAERGVTDAEVVALVQSPQVGWYQDDNDTWIIQDPQTYLAVIINKNAYIVTVYYG